MEPISIIVTALVVGAANGMKDIAETALKDSYNAIKEIISSRYSSVDISVIEKNPTSDKRQEILKEELAEANVGQDEELLKEAETLINLANKLLSEEALSNVGVELKEIEGGNLEIRRINSSGRGVVIDKGKFSGNLTITDVNSIPDNSAAFKKKST